MKSYFVILFVLLSTLISFFEAHAKEITKVLHFPKESVGRLYGQPELVDSCDSGLEAQGNVKIPQSTKITLNIHDEVKDLSFLSSCNAPELITEVSQSASAWSGNTLSHLRPLKNLQKLDLSKSKINDADLKHLAPFTQLEILDLSLTATTDEGLQYIRGIKALHSLDLSYTCISDEGIKHLAKLTQLKSLNLKGTQVSDQALQYLKDLKNLDELDISNTAVSEEGLKRLQLDLQREGEEAWIFCQNLKKVKGYIPSPRDIIIQFPKDHPADHSNTILTDHNNTIHLQSTVSTTVSLYRHVIHARGEIILPSTYFLNMESIEASSLIELLTHCNSAAQQAIVRLPRSIRWDDQELYALQKVPSLKRLYLGRSKDTSSRGFSYLSSLAQLEELDLRETNVSDQDLEKIGKLQTLKTLDLMHTSITDEGLKKLGYLNQLEDLHIPETKITDQGVQWLSVHMKNLKYLSLYSNPQLSEQVITYALDLPKLRHLNLFRTLIDDKAAPVLEKLIEQMGESGERSSLYLGETHVSEATIRRLIKIITTKKYKMYISSDFGYFDSESGTTNMKMK